MDSTCPGKLTGEPCLTLSQYTSGEYRKYTSDRDIILEVQPGRHTLPSKNTYYSSTVYLALRLVSFTMISVDSTAEVICGTSKNLISSPYKGHKA